MDFQRRFELLSPCMKWQFTKKAQGQVGIYDGFPEAIQEALNDFFTELETADKLKDVLLKQDLSSQEMAQKIKKDIESLSKKSVQAGTMGKLAGALAQGNELVYRVCFVAKQKGHSFSTLVTEHPCLVSTEEEYQKWLKLFNCSELQYFSVENQKDTAPYWEWVQTSESGKKFEDRRHRYTRAIHAIREELCPQPRLPYQSISHNGQYLLNRFGYGRN